MCIALHVLYLNELIITLVCAGWIEMEQRVWLRLKWIRQFAMINLEGPLKISSRLLYANHEYLLAGA